MPLATCNAAVSELSMSRGTVAPGGNVQLTIHVLICDGIVGYQHALQLSVADAPGGHAAMPGGTWTITPNPILVEILNPPPPGLFIGCGEADAVATLSGVPTSVDASRVPNLVSVPYDPLAAPFSEGVYEFQVTAVAAVAAQYAPPNQSPADVTSIAGGIVDSITHEAKSTADGRATAAGNTPYYSPHHGVRGAREWNGDVCIVPNDETVVAHGYLNEIWMDYYAGLYGGHFRNQDGSPTSAWYDGRMLWETLSPNGPDCCFREAVGDLNCNGTIDGGEVWTGRNPLVDYGTECRDFSGFSYPTAGTWMVSYDLSTSPPTSLPVPDGTWGTCAEQSTMDGIRTSAPCLTQYLTNYLPPRTITSCNTMTITQTMGIDCRAGGGWAWKHDYTPAKPLLVDLYHDHLPLPGSVRWSRSTRSTPTTQRQWPAYLYPPVCTD